MIGTSRRKASAPQMQTPVALQCSPRPARHRHAIGPAAKLTLECLLGLGVGGEVLALALPAPQLNRNREGDGQQAAVGDQPAGQLAAAVLAPHAILGNRIHCMAVAGTPKSADSMESSW